MQAWHPLLSLLVVCAALADVVHLKDGSQIEGVLRREQDGWSVTEPSGKVRRVSDDAVELVEKTTSLSPAQMAAGKLTALRRAVENTADINQVVERYTRFIEQNKGTPAAAQAGNDLDLWKDRLNRKLVKVGNSWVTPEEQAALLEKVVALVDQIRDLIKQGRLRDADALLIRLLAADPNNPSGLYLRGIVAHKQEQLGPAKKAFERVREILPDHAPTLNNLGVILWQQKQHAGALALYDLAMVAAPGVRQILDNVAEALNAFPNDQRESSVAKRAAKHFIDQDAELQKQLAAQGLSRWGATYVTADKMSQIAKAKEKIDARLETLKQDYQKIEDRIREIDDQLDSNDRILHRIAADRNFIDPATGGIISLPLPSAYYEVRRQSDRLKDEQRNLAAKLDGFKDKAGAIQQEMPVPAYTGLHRIIEVEGTPLVTTGKAPQGKAPPPTRPTTQVAR
jgi:tetratricopeptide (TPR) repeat protein